MQLNEILGNGQAKRAVEIAIAGNLSIKFIGNSEADLFVKYLKEYKPSIRAYSFKPCLCGNCGDPEIACECTRRQIIEAQALIKNIHTDLTIRTTRASREALLLTFAQKLPQDSKELLRAYLKSYPIGQEEVKSILKTAEVIMKSSNDSIIKPEYMAEAMQYRDIER